MEILELIILKEVNKLTLLPQGKQPLTCAADDTVHAFMWKFEFLETYTHRCGFPIFPGLKVAMVRWAMHQCMLFVFSDN